MSQEYETDGPVGGPSQEAAPAYWGSVLFFKHMILAVVVVLILVPTVLTVVLAVRSRGLAATVEQLESRGVLPPAGENTAGEVPPWQALYPDLYAQPAQRASVDEENTLYLTFDDGPSDQTEEILEVLAQYNVKATFFVVGRTDEESIRRLQDIVAAGHTIGIHSYSNALSGIYASVEDYLADFEQLYTLIKETTGVAPQIFRFPGGSVNGYNAVTGQEIIAEMVRRGFVYFDWNVMIGDAVNGESPPVEELVSNALSGIGSYRRVILLMHDLAGRPNTAAALPEIIQGYLDAGFTLASLTPEVRPIIFGYPAVS